MLEPFVITLREGLEAFLIVGISLSYLRKSGREPLTRAVYWGVLAALVLSVFAGYLLNRASNQEWLEGPLALVAAASVMWMVIHMWRSGRRMKGDIEGRLQSSGSKSSVAAFAGVFLFTLLMVSREGMETALLLLQLRETAYLVVGAIAGFVAAGGVGWLWSRYGHRVPLASFFQVTAIFLCVFVVQLVIQGTHEMAEQNLLPYSPAIHEGTEAWGPDSQFGHLLTYLLVILPMTWLAIRAISSSGKSAPSGMQSGSGAAGRPVSAASRSLTSRT